MTRGMATLFALTVGLILVSVTANVFVWHSWFAAAIAVVNLVIVVAAWRVVAVVDRAKRDAER